jgi:YHS domain-containing protein
MTVAVTPATLAAEIDGRTYYFCSSHCRKSFIDHAEALPEALGDL